VPSISRRVGTEATRFRTVHVSGIGISGSCTHSKAGRENTTPACIDHVRAELGNGESTVAGRAVTVFLR
jgi:hypothetical protein